MRSKMSNIPFQVENLINSLLNKNENIYIRGNYRPRLQEIKDAIEKSLDKYDREVQMTRGRETKRA
jgi:hypothetical protein